MTGTRKRAAVTIVATAAITLACAGSRPDNLGINTGALAACPSSPNCVSTEATDAEHRIAPFVIASSPTSAWDAAKKTVATKLIRTKILTATDDYLHAESTSAVMGYIDDLQLQLKPSQGIIEVRSSSRVGHSDWGVNRERVDRLRRSLINAGAIKPTPRSE